MRICVNFVLCLFAYIYICLCRSPGRLPKKSVIVHCPGVTSVVSIPIGMPYFKTFRRSESLFADLFKRERLGLVAYKVKQQTEKEKKAKEMLQSSTTNKKKTNRSFLSRYLNDNEEEKVIDFINAPEKSLFPDMINVSGVIRSMDSIDDEMKESQLPNRVSLSTIAEKTSYNASNQNRNITEVDEDIEMELENTEENDGNINQNNNNQNKDKEPRTIKLSRKSSKEREQTVTDKKKEKKAKKASVSGNKNNIDKDKSEVDGTLGDVVVEDEELELILEEEAPEISVAAKNREEDSVREEHQEDAVAAATDKVASKEDKTVAEEEEDEATEEDEITEEDKDVVKQTAEEEEDSKMPDLPKIIGNTAGMDVDETNDNDSEELDSGSSTVETSLSVYDPKDDDIRFTEKKNTKFKKATTKSKKSSLRKNTKSKSISKSKSKSKSKSGKKEPKRIPSKKQSRKKSTKKKKRSDKEEMDDDDNETVSSDVEKLSEYEKPIGKYRNVDKNGGQNICVPSDCVLNQFIFIPSFSLPDIEFKDDTSFVDCIEDDNLWECDYSLSDKASHMVCYIFSFVAYVC